MAYKDGYQSETEKDNRLLFREQSVLLFFQSQGGRHKFKPIRLQHGYDVSFPGGNLINYVDNCKSVKLHCCFPIIGATEKIV